MSKLFSQTLLFIFMATATHGSLNATESPNTDLISEFLEWSLAHPECLKRIQRSAAAHGKAQKTWIETKENITNEFNAWRTNKAPPDAKEE